MYNYSIMGLQIDHLDEICEDIIAQYRQHVTDMALFSMTLVPEGDPLIDKAAILCEKYDRFRDKLHAAQVPCGILVQASIGHGYKLNSPSPFHKIIGLTDGVEDNIVCPYDEDFRAFFRSQMRTVASHKPDLIMLDDDFRLLHRPARGCACPRHLEEIRKRTGVSYTREELWDIIKNNTPEGRDLAAVYTETQKEALIGAAKAYRAGIDDVDPSIPGAYCCVNGEFAYEIAKIMAGENHQVILRINNGNYTPAGARGVVPHMLSAAYQIQTCEGPVDAFLAETDTCPQNRYSTGASSLHTHFTGTILEGASGAKHWITRLSAYEPASGKAYRKMLAKNAGFYQALADLVPTLSWEGCRVAMPTRWRYDFFRSWGSEVSRGFACHVLERLGLPLYFSSAPGGAAFLDGGADLALTDEEILPLLRGPLFLDAQTAKNLIDRGFGRYLGVDVRPWNGPHTSGEILPNGNTCNAQVRAMELVPLSDRVKTDSVVFHNPDGKSRVPLFPGVTVFENELGGTAVVFCGDPDTVFNYIEAFSFLNESRKAQFVDLLASVHCLPIFADTDAEVYLRTARLPDGSRFVAFFNVGLDPLEEILLASEQAYTRARMLTPDGAKAEVPMTVSSRKDGRFSLLLSVPARTLDPVVLFLE